jgi:eukaryotic-like serine/threonine-protein kinase
MTPEFIGRYRIEAVLGRGAIATVFKAHDPDIDRAVAIKLVHGDLLDGPQRNEYLTRFRREAQAAARCVHPNIVAIYDFATEGGDPFIAMEFVPGLPLNAAIPPGGTLDLEPTVQLVDQLLAALSCAHALGVVHRDIKPANLMLLPDGRLKVTDFGISRLDVSELTSVGNLVGTPAYMSPEQIRGDTVDARTDLFATGVVLFELLSGTKPFAGQSLTETMRRLLSDVPADLSILDPSVPGPVRAVLARALAKPVEQRFQSAAAMSEALRNAYARSDEAAAAEPWSGRTIIAPPAPRDGVSHAAPGRSLDLPPQKIANMERLLAEHIGPIARRLLRDALKQARSADELCRIAAGNIEQSRSRSRFLTDAAAILDNGTGLSRAGAAQDVSLPPVSINAEALARVERDLARFLGPIARVLVSQALPGAASPHALRQALARHIERPDDRAAFLDENPSPRR